MHKSRRRSCTRTGRCRRRGRGAPAARQDPGTPAARSRRCPGGAASRLRPRRAGRPYAAGIHELARAGVGHSYEFRLAAEGACVARARPGCRERARGSPGAGGAARRRGDDPRDRGIGPRRRCRCAARRWRSWRRFTPRSSRAGPSAPRRRGESWPRVIHQGGAQSARIPLARARRAPRVAPSMDGSLRAGSRPGLCRARALPGGAAAHRARPPDPGRDSR